MSFPSPPPSPSVMASLRALPIPACVATLLVQVDEACALWIANCLVAELGPDFQTHQLRSYRPKLICVSMGRITSRSTSRFFCASCPAPSMCTTRGKLMFGESW